MLYIHIPFCKKKCIYCNFYSGGNPNWIEYLKAVKKELSNRIDEMPFDSLSSIYIGGGTPSLIPPELFLPFIEDIKDILSTNSISVPSDVEFTIEINPEDVNDETVTIWKTSGINRVSMGVQTLNDKELTFLNRRHSSAVAKNSLELLKRYFSNVSVDLMYGIPGQDKSSFKDTIETIIGFSPQHISLYALTFETGTPLFVKKEKGMIKETSDEDYNLFDDFASEILSKAGYERYEVSNYSLPGYQSKHNSGYWTGKPYLGLGPSACSYDGFNVRRNNHHDLKGYIKHFTSDPIPEGYFYKWETLSEEELLEEKVFLSMRTMQGLDMERFGLEFGERKLCRLMGNASRWIETGHLEKDDRHLKFTHNGIQISDYIILDLL